MMTPQVDILLATYNGARYLPELLRSLEAQEGVPWRVIVRDDGSTDHTPVLLRKWASNLADQVEILEDDLGGLGASGNFAALLNVSSAPRFMFCDQDDVWMAGKVARLYDVVDTAENKLPAEVPIYAHSDLRVVDQTLRTLHPSFWHYQALNPNKGRSLKHLLIENVVTGGASIGNAALRRRALPIPKSARMHDWWLALVAAAFGEIYYLPKATVLYRQHTGNVLGAKPWGTWRAYSRLVRRPFAVAAEKRKILCDTQIQAQTFFERYGLELPSNVQNLVHDYARLNRRSAIGRRAFIISHSLWFDSWIKNLGLLALI